jgi:hypothetical protein
VQLKANFRGSVATFHDTRGKESRTWPDLITMDWHIWNQTGNDMRFFGLWNARIPTLFQPSTLQTPAYYVLTRKFLSRPADTYSRGFMMYTVPDPRLLPLWGVRYVIADYALPFGVERMQMPVPQTTDPPLYNSPFRLFELPAPNLGDYSPVEVVRVDEAKEVVAKLGDASFDGRRTVVVTEPLDGRFVPATNASIRVGRGELSISAESAGESLLVLPVQYTHCWKPRGASRADLFRANLMQLGIRFSGKLDLTLRHVFGPFRDTQCRIRDVEDMKRLKISDADG